MEKRSLPGDTPAIRLRAHRRDQLYQFLIDSGQIRGAVLHATRMVGEMRANHDLGPLETLVLGQAYVAAGMTTAAASAVGFSKASSTTAFARSI